MTREEEDQRVESWNLEQFTRQEFDSAQAQALFSWGIDPHDSAKLIEMGCPHDTAMRILCPLDAPPYEALVMEAVVELVS